MEKSKIAYKGWENCYYLANDLIELYITTDVGPRIIHFGYKGEPNVLKQFDSQMGVTGGTTWHSFGGHRFWHAPEHPVRTYFPDNSPVKVEELPDGVKLIAPVETTTQVQKEIEIRLVDGKPSLSVTHRLINHNLWDIKVALWAITVMKQGSIGILPLPKRGSHAENLLPSSTLVLWAYTDFTDPRWRMGKNYIQLVQDANNTTPQKIGASVPDGWGASWVDGYLFIKQMEIFEGAPYVDLGSHFELFTNDEILELESVGQYQTIEAGTAREHVELWSLYRDIPYPDSEKTITEQIARLVN